MDSLLVFDFILAFLGLLQTLFVASLPGEKFPLFAGFSVTTS